MQDDQKNKTNSEENKQNPSQNKTFQPQKSSQNPFQDILINSQHIPKKYGGKKIIATIFVISLAIFGMGAGVYLLKTGKIQIGSAMECNNYRLNLSREGEVNIQNLTKRRAPEQIIKISINNGRFVSCKAPNLQPGESITVCKIDVPPQPHSFSWKIVGENFCENQGFYQGGESNSL